MAELDICVGSYNTLNDLSNKLCVSNKTEDLNISVFIMITGISICHAIVNADLMEENVIQINDGITIIVNMSVKNVIM